MNLFRSLILSRILIFMGGVTFLNMSFIVVEILALNISNDNEILKSISTGLEEENECGGESESEADSEFKEFFLDLNERLFYQNALCSITKKHMFGELCATLHDGHIKTYSPPPEIFVL